MVSGQFSRVGALGSTSLFSVPMPEAGKVAIAFMRCKCVYALFRLVIASGIGSRAVFAGHSLYSGQNSEFRFDSDAKTAERFTCVRSNLNNFQRIRTCRLRENSRGRGLQYAASCRRMSARIGISLSGRVGLSGCVKVVRIQPRC